jgi:tetratricopeptide (TPR) repeat protein
VPIEGPLKELQIHDVSQLLDLGRKTGVLRVTSELRQNAGVVYFANGGVIAAEIRSNPHPLGALLIRGGKVREEEVARAVAIQRSRPGHRLGDILVEIGALPRKELERQIRAQVEEVIFELMSWSEGYFSFEDGPLPEALGEATVRIPTESLLMEAARRIDEWSRIEAKVPHLGVVPRFIGSPDDEGTQLDLLPFEWEVLAGIDGATDVRSLAGRLGRSDFDVARTLFGLAAAGIIAMSEPTGVGQDAEATVQDLAVLVAAAEEALLLGEVARARFTAEEAVLAFAESAAAHLVLGRVLLAEARYDEAILRLTQALRCEPDMPAALRLLGLAEVGRAQFGSALEAWARWEALASHVDSERGREETVRRWRNAVETLKDALGGRREH